VKEKRVERLYHSYKRMLGHANRLSRRAEELKASVLKEMGRKRSVPLSDGSVLKRKVVEVPSHVVEEYNYTTVRRDFRLLPK